MRKKIEHPFQVPDDFFNEFKLEFQGKIESQVDSSQRFNIKKIVLNTIKYAAVVAIAFVIGRYSVEVKYKKSELTNIETIFNQVSEDEIVDFIIDNELSEEL